jgi:hypothetical protein
MYRAMDGPSVTTVPLPNGDAGTRKTLANMQRLVDSGSRDLVVRETAIRAIQSAGVSPHNVAGQIDALFEYVRDQVSFINDPVGTEWVQAPRYTLQVRGGDCDDRAVLLASLLRAIGVASSFKAVAADPRNPESFSHVYLMVGGRALDPTYEQNRLGTEPPFIARTLIVPAFGR